MASGFRRFSITSSFVARTLVSAGSKPMRVVVHKTAGAVTLVVGTDPVEVINALAGAVTVDKLPGGRIFYVGVDPAALVIDAGETLYAAGAPGVSDGAGALTVAVGYSDALEFEHFEYVP